MNLRWFFLIVFTLSQEKYNYVWYKHNFILKVKNNYRVSSRCHPAERNENKRVFYSCKQNGL
jgi:hypothetical protein